MEQGTPIFESFTESVGDGPSQPLIRKLMSLMLQPDPPRGEPDISGFFLVEAPPPLCMAGTSRDGPSEAAEEIGQVIDCPVEEVENIVQSGFRFGGTEGCCDTPGVENYLSESRIPIDLFDKVPIDLLHAINDAMDTRNLSETRGVSAPHNVTGAERVRAQVRNRGEEFFSLPGLSPLMGGTPKKRSTHGDGSIIRRLDRLENICLRTESYVHKAFGTLDKRLELLEAEAVRPWTSTRDSSCMTSPRSPPPRIPCEVGTFVTPEMLLVPHFSPVMPSSAIGLAVSCPVPEDAPASEDAVICLSPIDTISSPSLIKCTPVPLSSHLQSSEFSCSNATPESAESFHAGISVPESEYGRDETPETIAPATPATRESRPSSSSEAGPSSSLPSEAPEDGVEKAQVSAIAIFSLAGDATTTQETTMDALLSEPVVTWENEGFPYLRPTFQIAMEPPLKETTVLTWDAVGYLSAESTSDETDDGATSVSGDEALSFYNFEDESDVLGMEECSSSRKNVAREYEKILSNEDSILNEISSVLQNICTNLEALKEPEQNIIYVDAASTSGSCPHCHADMSQQENQRPMALLPERLAWQNQDEVTSVLEGVFSRLESSSHPENMLVSISPRGEPPSTSSATVAPANAEHVSYAELPQQEDSEEEEKKGSSFEVVPLESHLGIVPKVALSFNEENTQLRISGNEEVIDHKRSSSVQDMFVKIDLPPVQDAPSASEVPASPVTVHVAVVPKELQHHQEQNVSIQEKDQGDVSSIVQDICITVEGPYQEPIVCDKDVIPELAPQNRESVTISKDKLQLSDEVSADYTLKVVPRSSQQQDNSAAAAASSECSGQPFVLKQDENMLINQEEVSSVIHELCFRVEVPTSSSAKSPHASEEQQSTESVSASSPELPLQIAIALTGNSEMSEQENAPCNLQEEAASYKQQQPTIIFSLEALQKSSVSSVDQQHPSAAKAESSTSIQRSSSRCSLEDYMAAEEGNFPSDNHPLAFNWEGRADGTECEDIPCLLKIENRRTLAQDHVTSVHQEVCISVEVPTAPQSAKSGSRSPTPGAGVQIGIAVKTVPTRAGDEAGEQSISRVEIPEEKTFEKAPIEEIALVAERDVAPTKEELQPLTSEGPAESLYQEGVLNEDGSSAEENVVEPIVAPPPSPVDSDAPGPLENPFKEEDKKPGFGEEEWIIETIFLARENIRPIEAKVPKPVLKGITPMDLIRGSLHYDGKACLLSVSMDDFWTAEDMCEAPAAFGKPKSTFEPFCLRGSVQDLKYAAPQPGWLGKLAGGMKPVDVPEKNQVQTFGFQGGIKQVESSKVQSAFGFRHSLNAPEQQPPQAQFTELVFGFRSSLQQSKPMQVQQQPPQPQSTELVFGFHKSQESKPETQPPLLSILQQSLSLSLPTDDVFADWDSSLSVVSRSPPRRVSPGLKQTMNSSSKPSQDQEQLKPRVPDSPGARSCIFGSGKGESPKGMTASTSNRLPDSKLEQEQQNQVTRPSAAAAAAAAPTPPATGTSAPREPLDLLDAPMSEEEQVEWTIGLHVLPLEAPGVLQEDTFFDALQCSGLDSKLENACAACLEALVLGYQRQRPISRMHTRHKLFLQPVASSS